MRTSPRLLVGMLTTVSCILVQHSAEAQRLAWRKVTPVTSPPPTYGHAMTYDPVRQRVVSFGGVGGDLCCTSPNADVWEWDGSTWSKHVPAGGVAPPPRLFGALAYAPGVSRVLAFGGLDAASVPNDETWLWDGSTWTLVPKPAPPAVSPPARFRAPAVSAGATLGVLLFPGATAVGLPESGAIFQFDKAWTMRPEQAPVLVDYGAGWSPKTQRGYMFGGRPCSSDDAACAPQNKIHHWADGEPEWSTVPGVGAPRWGTSFTFHGTAGGVAIGGGANAAGNAIADDYALTFQYPGGFTQTFAQGLSPRVFHAAAWDEARQQVVAFGGLTQSVEPFGASAAAILGDTWVLDAIGNECANDAACTGGHCVDGVCCVQASCGTCQACNVGNAPGTCARVSLDKDPDSCATACDAGGKCVVGLLPLGLACTTAGDCVSGQCVDGTCCNEPACGICESCGITGSKGVCSAVLGPDPDSCPNGCDYGGKKLCRKSAGDPCTTPIECASGQCIASVCGGQPIGTKCTTKGQCTSGGCVDGTCCESPSCSSCQTCADPLAVGKCTKIVNGPDDDCDMLCDAAGTCPQKPLTPDGDVCAKGDACASGICWRDVASAAQGVCCATTCPGACSSCDGGCHALPAGAAPRADASCGADLVCDGTALVCVPKPSDLGTPCVTGVSCSLGVCVDGVCCDDACGGACQACSKSRGSPADGTCAVASLGALPRTSCDDGITCDGKSPLCSVKPDPCADVVCGPGERCDPDKGCVGPHPVGSPCQLVSECGGASPRCLSGRCCDIAADPTCGLRCNEDRTSVIDTLSSQTRACPQATHCQGGYCVSDGRCGPGQGCAAGELCTADGVCVARSSAARAWDLASPTCSLGSTPSTGGQTLLAAAGGFLLAIMARRRWAAGARR